MIEYSVGFVIAGSIASEQTSVLMKQWEKIVIVELVYIQIHICILSLSFSLFLSLYNIYIYIYNIYIYIYLLIYIIYFYLLSRYNVCLFVRLIWNAFCSNFGSFFCSFNGLLLKVLDSQSRGPSSKPLDGSKVDSAFHSFEVSKISTSNFINFRDLAFYGGT